MVEENMSQEFWLKNIKETGHCFIKEIKWVYESEAQKGL